MIAIKKESDELNSIIIDVYKKFVVFGEYEKVIGYFFLINDSYLLYENMGHRAFSYCSSFDKNSNILYKAGVVNSSLFDSFENFLIEGEGEIIKKTIKWNKKTARWNKDIFISDEDRQKMIQKMITCGYIISVDVAFDKYAMD